MHYDDLALMQEFVTPGDACEVAFYQRLIDTGLAFKLPNVPLEVMFTLSNHTASKALALIEAGKCRTAA